MGETHTNTHIAHTEEKMMNVGIKIFLMSGDPTVLRRIGRWALKDEFNLDDTDDVLSIKGPKSSNGGMVDLKVEYEINSCLNWLSNLPEKKKDETENSAEVTMSGKINFWKAHDIISQIGRLKFLVNHAYTEICEGLDDTDFSIVFQMPVSYFEDLSAETQTQAIVSVSKEDGHTKNEAPSTEKVMLHKLKEIVQQSESESAMIENIIFVLGLNPDAAKLLRRAYNNYKALAKAESKQLREALAPVFEGKRIDHTMKELKKLYDQYHPTTAAVEFPDSQEVTAVTSVSEENTKSETSGSTPEPSSDERYIFDNTKNAEPPHTDEGQRGDGDDTSSEEDDEEEDPHTLPQKWK